MVASTTAWLNGIGQKIQIAGVLKGPTTNLWNFVAGATAVFNVATGAMDITITGGGGGGGGTGDVVGPASSADDRVALFSGTTGKLLKQSSFAISGILKANGSTPLTADWSLGGYSLTNVKSITYGSAPFDNGNSGTSDTINWQAGDIQKSTLTGDVTYAFTAPFGVGGLTLEIIQDATGGRTITWPATVDWAAGVAPTIASGANAVSVVTFYWNGSRYRGYASSGGVSVHSALTGLGADDHTQYSLVTGTRAFTGGITVTQAAVSGAGQKAFLITGGAHTALTAATEAIDVDFALNRTVQWATGGITKQRAAVFRAPTWGFVGASVVTDAATLTITGAPVAGTNASFTRSYALWIESGSSRFDGNVSFGAGVTSPKLFQEANATNGATAQNLLVQAQNATGTTSTGGSAIVQGGSGTSINGGVSLRSGSGNDILLVADSSSQYLTTLNATAAVTAILQFADTSASALAYAIQAHATGAATGRALIISGQPAATTGGDLILASGQGSATTPGAVQLKLGGYVNGVASGGMATMFEMKQLAASRRVTSLNFNGVSGAGVTTTEMPANTGDFVTFIGNALVNPSANPVGGGILYCDAGALKYRGTSGTVTTVAPA